MGWRELRGTICLWHVAARKIRWFVLQEGHRVIGAVIPPPNVKMSCILLRPTPSKQFFWFGCLVFFGANSPSTMFHLSFLDIFRRWWWRHRCEQHLWQHFLQNTSLHHPEHPAKLRYIYIYMIFSVRYSSTRVMRFWARIRPASFALLNIYTFWDLIARVLIILQFLLGLPTYHNSFLPLLYLSSCSVVHPKWLHFCSAIAAIHMPGRLRAMSRNGFGKLSICSVQW